jgi:hypothetical protein
MRNPIINGVRYSARTYGNEPRVFALIQLERRHTYGKHTAHGERTRWRKTGSRELGMFATRTEAKAAVKGFLDAKRQDERAANVRFNPRNGTTPCFSSVA